MFEIDERAGTITIKMDREFFNAINDAVHARGEECDVCNEVGVLMGAFARQRGWEE